MVPMPARMSSQTSWTAGPPGSTAASGADQAEQQLLDLPPAFREELRVGEDDLVRVADLVGHPGGQQAQRGETSGLDHRLLLQPRRLLHQLLLGAVDQRDHLGRPGEPGRPLHLHLHPPQGCPTGCGCRLPASGSPARPPASRKGPRRGRAAGPPGSTRSTASRGRPQIRANRGLTNRTRPAAGRRRPAATARAAAAPAPRPARRRRPARGAGRRARAAGTSPTPPWRGCRRRGGRGRSRSSSGRPLAQARRRASSSSPRSRTSARARPTSPPGSGAEGFGEGAAGHAQHAGCRRGGRAGAGGCRKRPPAPPAEQGGGERGGRAACPGRIRRISCCSSPSAWHIYMVGSYPGGINPSDAAGEGSARTCSRLAPARSASWTCHLSSAPAEKAAFSRARKTRQVPADPRL